MNHLRDGDIEYLHRPARLDRQDGLRDRGGDSATCARRCEMLYGSTDGGAHWTALTANLPAAPANALWLTRRTPARSIWPPMWGSIRRGRSPTAPRPIPAAGRPLEAGCRRLRWLRSVRLRVTATVQNLVAATYGRGIWMAPVWTAGLALTNAAATPDSLTFASQMVGSSSAAQTVTVTNTGSADLMPTWIAASGDFSETDDCLNATVAAGASCTIQVTLRSNSDGQPDGYVDRRTRTSAEDS